LDISDAVLLQEDHRFRAKEFTQTKRNIHKLLLSKGYCSPKLNTKAYLDLEKYTASIKIVLKKQKMCYFGNVTIETSSPTMSDDIILSRLHFEEGDVFDINKIKESYESLYSLEAFDQLNLDYSLNLYNLALYSDQVGFLCDKYIKQTSHLFTPAENRFFLVIL